jgi:cytochrome c553
MADLLRRLRKQAARGCKASARRPQNQEQNTVRLVFTSLAALALTFDFAHAGDPALGRKVAAKCQVCHGLDGQSKNPEAPHISGQVERYIIKALKRYISGEREDAQMSMIVKQLKDGDLENVAAYYASIKVTVEKPQ